MKIPMQICAHRTVRQYSLGFEDDTAESVRFGTCVMCYQRLRADGGRSWERDAPVTFLCNHRDKDPIPNSQLRIRSVNNSYDALCMLCGTVLRHPDGPGAWEEVVFSGFIIREEP